MTDPQRQPYPNTCEGTIIHIGAGRCTELPDYLAANPARIILVEPQPERARALRRHAADHNHVEVIEAAIAGAKTGNKLKVFNQRDLSSLRMPTGLMEIYPGLRTTRELEVECFAPDQLIEQAGLTTDTNWLIIDASGEEAAIVEALVSSEQLTAFTRIDLYYGNTALYEGSQPATALLSKLAEFGHEVEFEDTETDPDLPRWSLYRNVLKLENITLQEQLRLCEQELAKLEAQIDLIKELLLAHDHEHE